MFFIITGDTPAHGTYLSFLYLSSSSRPRLLTTIFIAGIKKRLGLACPIRLRLFGNIGTNPVPEQMVRTLDNQYAKSTLKP